MKINVYASSNIDDLKKKISSALYEFIKYELWEQDRKEYYKPVRRQFTVNGKKYIVKNNAKGRLLVLNPEGKDLYGYLIPSTLYNDTTDDIAVTILNDAYGNDIDVANKRIFLNLRYGYVSYGSASPGVVTFGTYVNELRRCIEFGMNFAHGDPSARYISYQVKAWWSNNDDNLYFSNDADELIRQAEEFIDDGANSYSTEGSMGETEYRYYADVIDTETGEEIYFDKATSKPLEER